MCDTAKGGAALGFHELMQGDKGTQSGVFTQELRLELSLRNM